jgi:D-serine deaminase-like pyridoxal phosphate-dependent protein
MKISDLDTPCVLIDVDVMERNLKRFQTHCDDAGLRNRPHIKTHKIPGLARRQLELGAAGITCQKLGEAEVMAEEAGAEDILVTYNILGARKLERAVSLAGRVSLTVTCDDEIVARGLSDAFGSAGLPLPVLVECDTGGARCGVQTTQDAVRLAELIDGLPGLAFRGLMTYPAKGRVEQAAAFFATARDALSRKGLAAEIISSGGTPELWKASTSGGVTEWRAGTYIYNDRMTVAAGAAQPEDCAMTVLATVVSRPTADRAVLDAGSKALSSDVMSGQRSLGPAGGYGFLPRFPAAGIARLNEEHGVVDLSACNDRPVVGDRLRIVPNHACVVSNLFDRVYAVRGEEVVETWKVAARGCLT